MKGRYRHWTTALAAMAVASLASTLAHADSQGERDAQEVSHYVLTEAGLAKYAQAVHNLGAQVKSLPGACADSEAAKSLNDIAARMDAVPQIKAAMSSAGLSSREYLVFSFSLLQNGMAAWVLAQPGGKLPPGTSMANVKFYQAHDAALKKLGEEAKGGECEEDDRGNDDSGSESAE
jgi:hypothetical protein